MALNLHNHQGQEHLCRRSAICWASAMLQSLLHLKATQLQHMPGLQMLTQNISSKMKSAESPRRKRGVGSMAANAKYLTATRAFSWLASCARKQRCKPRSVQRVACQIGSLLIFQDSFKHIRKVLPRAYVLENAMGVLKKDDKGSSVKFIDTVMQLPCRLCVGECKAISH